MKQNLFWKLKEIYGNNFGLECLLALYILLKEKKRKMQ